MSVNSGRQFTHSDHMPVQNKLPLVLLLNDFTVPMNVGSVFRLADALGVQKIFLTGDTPVPPNKNIRKTSRSTEQYVDFEYRSDALGVIQALRQAGFTIASLEITSVSRDLSEINFSQYEKLCLIPGAENNGVSQTLLDASDFHIHIPMQGQNSSMNVAMACGIAVYTISTNFRKR